MVDLPRPGGPGHQDQSLGLLGEVRHDLREAQFLKAHDVVGNRPDGDCHRPRCRKTLARNRLKPFTPKEKSSSFSSSNLCFCASVRML